jgi:ABC-type uncharacterized transport system permease subunit
MIWLYHYESTFLFLAAVLYLAAMAGFWWQISWCAPEDSSFPLLKRDKGGFSASPHLDEISSKSLRSKIPLAPLYKGEFVDNKTSRLIRICDLVLAAGAFLQLLALLGQGSSLLDVRSGAAGLFAWILIIAYLVLGRWGRSGLGALVTPIVLFATLFSLAAPPLHRSVPLAQLETDWLIVHLSIILISYVALTFAFGASFIYLWHEKLLKSKQLRGIWQNLPSLQVADEWIFRATCFGTAMLTLGIGTGLLWLRLHPEYQFFRDPKVLFTTATWSIFALYLVSRFMWGWQGRRSRYIVLGGFVLMVVTFLGTPHLLAGIGR